MSKRFIVLMSLIITLAAIGSAFAQDDGALPNDPNVNPNANACFAGGTLAGRCNPVDANGDGVFSTEEIQFGWIGGWYLIRFEAGLISRDKFPVEYTYLLPPLTAASALVGCFANLSSGADLDIAGGLNILQNGEFWSSEDGTCSGTKYSSVTIVQAANYAAALALCESLGLKFIYPENIGPDYATLPDDIWFCEGL